MHLQTIEQMTRGAVDMLFRYAAAVPEDKLTWRPAPTATTVMEILQENAVIPFLLAEALRRRPKTAEGALWEQAKSRAGALETREACEQACRAGTEELLHTLRDTPAEELDQKIVLPWQASVTLLEAALVHYWNLTYHLGQVAYIQRLYGDTNYY
ncbi:MAG: hypothetical protein RMM06_07070 [Armatimonadota bacterium]|nr:DinB family protein [bacterium]MCS7308881.1 DinB family protein [Armatimonadota bacterium]MDW8103411.1 hypothetical protein [Armatimonadota bacterium]MDW8290469.1 hypothetical protein [Armatimonadota bacterium]